jgi:hypothetical protein
MRAAAYLGAMANAAGVLDIGLVFPHATTTYEPSDQFPIVWASQNDNLAKYLEFGLEYRLLYSNSSNNTGFIAGDRFQRYLSDFSGNRSDLYFYWWYFKLDVEGPVRLGWTGSWVECEKKFPGTPDAYTGYSVNKSSNFVVDFELKRGGQKADLIAATANNEECPNQGFAISVTDETNEVPKDYRGLALKNATCAVVDSSPSPTPTANPCRVKIDKAVAESVEAAILKNRCRSIPGSLPEDRPANCPKEDHAFRQLATAGTATLAAAALGALGFLLA